MPITQSALLPIIVVSLAATLLIVSAIYRIRLRTRTMPGETPIGSKGVPSWIYGQTVPEDSDSQSIPSKFIGTDAIGPWRSGKGGSIDEP